MIDLERIALMRAEEQHQAGAWRIIAPNTGFEYVGWCRRCNARQITAQNKSGLCRPCHQATSQKAREQYRIGPPPPASEPKVCCGPRCHRPVAAKGLCVTHYKQQLAGKPLKVIGRYQRSILPPMPTREAA